uniref:Uncharacterized protein n=1 Tax=Anguilla anguilla TaxID=7936 RepID=A0A0E9SHY6_ANGAN
MMWTGCYVSGYWILLFILGSFMHLSISQPASLVCKVIQFSL